MKFHSLAAIAAAACLFAACEKDKDNNTGGDVADQYVGNYLYTDTVTLVSNSDTTVSYPAGSSVISKLTAGTVVLRNFSQVVCDSVPASVTATSMVPTGDAACPFGNVDFPMNFICSKQGNTLYYSFVTNATPLTAYYVRGKAVKQ